MFGTLSPLLPAPPMQQGGMFGSGLGQQGMGILMSALRQQQQMKPQPGQPGQPLSLAAPGQGGLIGMLSNAIHPAQAPGMLPNAGGPGPAPNAAFSGVY